MCSAFDLSECCVTSSSWGIVLLLVCCFVYLLTLLAFSSSRQNYEMFSEAVEADTVEQFLKLAWGWRSTLTSFPHPPRVLSESCCPVSLSLSLSAPLAVTTHFQCHNEKCQISWILLISKDTFPLMHHYAWNQSYSLFMSFFLSIWFLSDLILSIWQASVSAPGPLGINGLSEYAVIRSTNLGCGQLIAGD